MQAAPAPASFPPAARLHKPAEFAAALKGRRIGQSAWLMLSASRVPLPPQSPSVPAQARLGLVVPKRYAKRAVTRNAIKRVLREAFRHQQGLTPRDYVFRLHSRIQDQSLTQLKQQARSQADALLQQAKLRLS